MALSFDSITSLLLVDVSSGPKTIQLPYASQRPGRVLTIKDSGFCNINKSITILCAGSGFSGDKFETGGSTYSIAFVNGYITVVSDPSLPGWRIIAKSEIDLPPEFNDVITVNISSMNANLSTISTNNINTRNISAAIATVERGYFKYAEIENLSVNVLFANIVSTAITQDITGVTVDNAYISSATISSLVAYSTFTSQLHVNDIHAKDISSGVINLGFSTLSTGIANLANISFSAFSTLSTAISELDYSTTVRYTSTVVGIQALTAASVRSTVHGLGTVGYVSTTTLAAYLNGLGSDGYVSTSGMNDTVTSSLRGLGSLGYISTVITNSDYITSTTTGLGSIGYISTIIVNQAYVRSTTQGLGRTYVSTQSMTSSLEGLGSLGYISTIGTNSAYITSTTQGLGSLGYISSIGTDSNYIGSSIAGLGSLAYVSTASLVSTVFGLQNTAAFSTANGSATSTIYGGGFVTTLTASLTSTIEGLSYAENLNSSLNALGTQGYISSLSLRSTVAGLGAAGYISTTAMAQALRSTVGGLGKFYVSSITLKSTLDGLGQIYVSTTALTAALASTLEASDLSLQSTIDGLGELSYISTTSLTQTLTSTIQGLGRFYISSTGLRQALTSSINGLGSYYISTSALQSTIDGLGELSYISSTALDQRLISTIDGLASYYISSSTLQSSIDGLGQKFVSTATLAQRITSTVSGLGQTYISSTSLKSSLEGLGSLGYTSSINSDSIKSTVAGLGSSRYVSTSALVSTVVGLGSTEFFTTTTAYVTSTVYGLGYISTLAATLTSTVTGESYGSSLTSSINTLGSIGYLSTPTLTSTIEGLGQRYISTLTVVPESLASTTQGLGQSYVSTPSLISTVEGLGEIFVSTLTVVPASLTSTVQGLGQTYVSTQSVTSTVQGLGQRYISSISLISTTQGLGQTYVSTASLFSTIEGLGEIFVSTLTVVPASLTSTTQGLGQRYISTQSLTSTVQGLGQRYISTLTVVPASLVSTTEGLGETYVSTLSLISSLEGLGSLGYISTVITNEAYITSTTQGLGTAGYISTIIVNQAYVTSTTRGLGRTYVSTQSMISTIEGLGQIYTSAFAGGPFITTSTIILSDYSGISANSLFTSSSLLYYNSSIIAGATVAALTNAIPGSAAVSSAVGFVTTYAGNGFNGTRDGGALSAGFNTLRGLTFDPAFSTLTTIDSGNRLIRRVALATSSATTFVGAYALSGFTDGYFSTARLLNPYYSVGDREGNIYFTDQGSNLIRKLTPSGFVSTIAGFGNVAYGLIDGFGSNARFSNPTGITIDSLGANLYVVDTWNHAVRRINLSTMYVSTIAGGVLGSADGVGRKGILSGPFGVNIDQAGANLYIAPSQRVLRRYNFAASTLHSMAGSASNAASASNGFLSNIGFNGMFNAIPDAGGNVYVSDFYGWRLRYVTSNGIGTTVIGSNNGFADGPGATATVVPNYSIMDSTYTNIYIADSTNHRIRRYNIATSTVTTVVGNGNAASIDGLGGGTRFNFPSAIIIDSANANIYIGDNNNNRIRRLNLATSTVTTYAGNGTGNAIDGISTNTASITSPEAMAIDSAGTLYYCDRNFHRVRKVTTAGSVVSIVGSSTANGSADGIGAGALLTYPSGICIDSTGTNAYITEYNNNWVRRVVLATGQVIRLAGSGSTGSNDAVGVLATFNGPTGICIDNTNTNLYVCDQANHRIRQIVIATSNVTTLAGSGTPAFADGTGVGASFSLPRQICFNSGNVFITDFNNNRIRRIVVSSGVVTTIAGSATASSVDGVGASASFNGPFGITIDSTGTNLYVGDYSSHCIRRIRLSDSNVLTISGSNATAGYRDGIGAAGASLNGPNSIGIDSTNTNLYFTEGNPGNRVRRVNLTTNIVSTIAGSGTASAVDGVGTSASFFNPAGIVVDTLGNLWVSEISSYLIRRITLATTYVSTIAGNGSNTVDAQGINAAFRRPWGMCIDPPGSNLFIAEYDGGRIRRLNIATTQVTTLIGTTVGFDMDGHVNGATFNYPEGIAIDSTNSNLYVSDTVGNKIRVINLNTTYVSTVCGTGGAGNGDGIGINATLNRPGAMRFDTMSNLYFVENNGYRIKKLALATTYVSTCAGTGGSAIIDGNGTAAAFATLGDITFDSNASTMYITDQHRIRFMNMSTMTVSTLAGGGPSYLDNVSGSGAQFSNNFPGTPCIDSNNTIYAVEFNSLRMILSSGTVSTLATPGLGNITGIALDTSQSTLFIADANATRIWAMNLSTVTRTLKAGGGTVTGDGWALAASVNYPRGITCDSNNNVYYGEGNNNVVRKITPDGRILTVAGNGRGGAVINGFMGARFINPSGIALDSTGSFGLIADGGGGSSRIRRFNLTTFNVSTIAGSGSNASTDGSNIYASLVNTQGIAVDASNNSYIGEQFRIRTVNSSGYVSTLIGSNSSGANDGIYTSVRMSSAIPQMALAGSELYFCDQGNNRVRRVNVTTGQTVTIGGNGAASSTDGSWGGNRFSNPQATCLDPTKAFLFIADPGNNVIRRMTLATGLTETYCGSGTSGFLDGNAYTCQFNNPMGIWMDSAGILYVSDTGNNRIRKITADGNVTTLAGNGATSFSNGIGTAATFNYPQGLVTDSTATRLYVSDFSNNRIRIITLATSNVATLAGNGTLTSTDGIGAAATLWNPQGIAIDSTDTNLYVMDVNGSKFRSIVISTSNVSTIAGNGSYVNTDGTGANAAFHYSQSVALDGVGNAYTGNRGGSFLIRKIVLATGVVTTFAGNATNSATDGTGTGASFATLGGGICSDNNFLYVTDNSNIIRRVSLPGAVTTTIGGTRGTSGYFNGFFSTSPATFNSPYGCALDNTNTNLYISDQNGARIRRIVLATGVVTTIAGTGTSTWADGTGLSAGFNAPKGMFVDNANGNLWIVESHRVRKLVLATSNVTTIAGAATTGSNDAIGAAATFNDPRSVILNPAGTTLFVTDYANCRIRSIDVTQSNVSSIAGFSQGCADGTGVGNSLANPVNMTVDFNNNLYVKDVDNNRVRMLNLNTGYLSTFTTLTNTNGMAADPTNSSILYMTTTSNIFRADISTQTFATFVGSNNVGYNDGFGSAAAFNGMTAACVDRTGAIYITEASRVRKIT